MCVQLMAESKPVLPLDNETGLEWHEQISIFRGHSMIVLDVSKLKQKEESYSFTPGSALPNFPEPSVKQQSDSAECSAWDKFPLKYHTELLCDSVENSDNDEEFMKKYNTELFTSDTDETTDDDEDFEEFMKKLRMKTRPKLKDKKTR